MKKFLIITIIIQSVFFISCEDILTLYPPDGLIHDEFWKNKEDVESVLMAAYNDLGKIDDRLFYYGEIRGDMLIEDRNLNGNLRNIKDGNIYPGNAYANWNPFYSIINNCNMVIKYLPEVKNIDPTFSPYKFNTFKAEAIFLRSLTYFYMVRIWRDVPFVLEPYDSDSQDFFVSKTDGDIIVDSLRVQLDRILNIIPKENETIERTRGRATHGAVNALLADIALWEFDYQACIEYIQAIEENELYELLPGGQWFNIFSEGNTLEGIFEVQFDGKLGQNNSLYGITQPQSNNILASTFAMELLAPRISGEIVRGNGALREQDQLIWKYIGQRPDGLTFRSGSDRFSCNWVVYRLADVMLMKAEALSQLGEYDQALAIVNDVRTRAFVEPFSSFSQTPNAFEDLILLERARELAYEGKRWFDLLRMGRRNNFERKDKLIEIITEYVPAAQKRVLASKLTDPYGWYFPIHENEIENNLNLVQNPYYQVYE